MSSAEPVGAPAGGATTVWPWAVAAVPAALLATLVGLALTGASAPTLVGDPGALVRWGEPLVGVLIQLAQAATLGGLVMLAFVLPDGAARRTTTGLVAVAGPVWALLSVLDLVLGYALVAGRPIGGAGFGNELGYYLGEISSGRAQLVSAVLAALVALACVAVAGHRSALAALVLGVAALVPDAAGGHAAGSSNHELGMNGVFGHVLGSAVWTGGLAVLALTARRLGATAADVAQRFSAVAVWCFALVVVSGTASAWIRVGSPVALGTRYGWVLLGKIALLATLGAAGWWHRTRTIAAMRRGRDGLFWRLIAVEVALVGLASGLGVALAGSAPPVLQEPVGRLTPTELVSDRPPPPTPTPEAILTAFYPDLFFGFVVVAMLVVYLGWVLRLRRRGDRWPLGRTLSWVAGTLVLGYLVLGAPAVYGHVMLSVHMAAHMAYVMVVPILLVLAAPVTLALRALPARTDGSHGPREWLLGIVHSRWGRFVATPVVAAVVFIATMVGFYLSPLLLLAATTHIGHILMVVHFLLSGYLFINGLIGIDPGPQRPGYPMRLLLLFATMAAHAFFGLALMTMTELLAADYYGALGLPWGVDALADQHAAGEIAWGIGEIPAVGVAVLLALAWARDDARLARRKDRAADRDGDVELEEYNRMLADLAERERS
ncbi:cytochrome c oxidase assembly protein [Actinotalea caeni]|uniref:cytochrome c oxidase assembly protein n=1 Tax=Actinotalea caeni TaxID=1348467 RepID=UPI001F043FAB|nr:cytochrome c oxidase assembly protein [Actinotalea caeni]